MHVRRPLAASCLRASTVKLAVKHGSNALVTATAPLIPLAPCFTWVSPVALAHGSSAALPVVAVFIITVSMALLPPATPGGIYLGGRRRFNAPCRTTCLPREIPTDAPWSVPQRRKCLSRVP